MPHAVSGTGERRVPGTLDRRLPGPAVREDRPAIGRALRAKPQGPFDPWAIPDRTGRDSGLAAQILARDVWQVVEQELRHFLLLADEALAHGPQLGHAELLGPPEQRAVGCDLEVLVSLGRDAVLRHRIGREHAE